MILDGSRARIRKSSSELPEQKWRTTIHCDPRFQNHHCIRTTGSQPRGNRTIGYPATNSVPLTCASARSRQRRQILTNVPFAQAKFMWCVLLTRAAIGQDRKPLPGLHACYPRPSGTVSSSKVSEFTTGFVALILNVRTGWVLQNARFVQCESSRLQ